MSYRDSLRMLAFDGHGVITTLGAARLGVPAVEVRKLASRGALTRIGHGVYRMEEAPTDALTPFAEAIAQVGPGAVIADESVLEIHDLAQVNPNKITVVTSRRVRGQLPATILVKRLPVDRIEVDYVEGVPVMPLHTAMVRCAGRVLPDRLEEGIDDALGRKLITAQQAAVVRSAVAERRLRQFAAVSNSGEHVTVRPGRSRVV